MTKQPIKTGATIKHKAECISVLTNNRMPCNCKEKPITSKEEAEKVADEYFKTTEQPNQNLILIEAIEGLLSQVNEKLGNLEEPWKYNYKTPEIAKAFKEIDLLQKTTMHDLRKAFE